MNRLRSSWPLGNSRFVGDVFELLNFLDSTQLMKLVLAQHSVGIVVTSPQNCLKLRLLCQKATFNLQKLYQCFLCNLRLPPSDQLKRFLDCEPIIVCQVHLCLHLMSSQVSLQLQYLACNLDNFSGWLIMLPAVPLIIQTICPRASISCWD